MYLYVKNKRAFAMIILFPITNSTMLSYANLEKGYSTNIDKMIRLNNRWYTKL